MEDRSQGLDKLIADNKENSMKKDTKRAKELQQMNQEFQKV